ncbi:MAG TPA: hypothetical protein GYA07_02590 [Verrucomicrobia bacterium]|nr:hypothetical protein [Verrucomicrobiota bacterium]HOB32410.1 hypothetical protein [Verrucomicrobiota bacterium]HOP98487.1 hypothetical protein [Verrucomicrobiota bacterium]HPU56828.1 hypothetical protein [Verrucomicrobiota bacterium]
MRPLCYQVNAFTRDPFPGIPAGGCPLESGFRFPDARVRIAGHAVIYNSGRLDIPG